MFVSLRHCSENMCAFSSNHFIILYLGYTEADPQPSTLGLGFDPSGIQPESGFKPILEQGGGLPTLAFSVLVILLSCFDIFN